jgi:hypothetical protein
MLSNGKGVKWRRSLAQAAKWSFCPTAGKAKGETKRRVRLVHSPAFAAKLALEAVKSDRELARLSEQFRNSQNRITILAGQLIDHTADAFARLEQAPAIDVSRAGRPSPSWPA